MLCADGFQPLLGLGRKAAEGFLLQLVGEAGLDVRTVGVVRAARKIPIPHRPELGHRQAGQLRDPCRDGLNRPGQLLGQLAHRKLLGSFEDRLCAWAALRNPGASKAGHHELDGLLQLPQIAFELGLSQPYAIRETLVRGTA